jgi:hypothetical protein
MSLNPIFVCLIQRLCRRQRHYILLVVERTIHRKHPGHQQGIPEKEHAAPVSALRWCTQAAESHVFSPDKNPGVKGINERFARLGVITAILRDTEGRKRCVHLFQTVAHGSSNI